MLNVTTSPPYYVCNQGFSPGKPDLCSDQTHHFGRSKVGGLYTKKCGPQDKPENRTHNIK